MITQRQALDLVIQGVTSFEDIDRSWMGIYKMPISSPIFKTGRCQGSVLSNRSAQDNQHPGYASVQDGSQWLREQKWVQRFSARLPW